MADDDMMTGEDIGYADPTGTGETEAQQKIPRGEPQISESRRRLVQQWASTVQADKAHWKTAFDRMRDDQDFCLGRQWSKDWNDDRYVANITLRHVQQRVAALYAKNPKVVSRRREKLLSSTWDGTMGSIMLAMQQIQQAAALGDQQAAMGPMQILQEAQQAVEYKAQMERFGKTLEMLYQHEVDEQVHPFKTMMKLVVRRAVTTGVGYIRVGFQRIMQPRPDTEARIADATQKLSHLEAMLADFADGQITDDQAAEKESLRLQLQALQAETDVLVREGLVFDYPDSTAVIPDRKTRQLREFLGADHVTQEYVLTPQEIKEIYGVDVGKDFTSYRVGTTEDPMVSPTITVDDSAPDTGEPGKKVCLVWDIYDRVTGLVYTVCDGYKDFLREPAPPEVWTERFYPWFPLVLNECDHPSRIYPPSDVSLLRDPQREYNRLREGLREHRIANRPAVISAGGTLSEEDMDKLINRPANAVIELDGLQPGQTVEQLLQAMKNPGVDPNLYEVNGIFEDVLRTVGVQEANLGAVSGGTATESSIAESSRQSSLASAVDDLDELLTQIARTAGQILLGEMSAETVTEIVGPGAVWPELSRDQMAKELFLEIEAGSTGKPNQAQEIQNFERLAPILMQIPGITPEMMAKEAIRRLDDRLELDDVYDQNMLSIQSMNQMAGRGPTPGAGTGPETDPNAQGAEGEQNAPRPGQPAGASPEGTVPQQVQ